MIRMTNKKDQATQIVYVDRPIVHRIEVEKQVMSEPEVIFQDREVIKEVSVEVEKLVHMEAEKMDLEPIHNKFKEHEDILTYHKAEIDTGIRKAKLVAEELEMQRRALVAVKAQRDIDRNRRFMFMNRVRRERDAMRKLHFKLKLAVGASLLVSIISLLIKL
jgi:hypothetical protein